MVCERSNSCDQSNFTKLIEYLFINYNKITNYILIIYKLSNLDHVLGIVSQTRVSGGNQTHDPHANSLIHYPLDYHSTLSTKETWQSLFDLNNFNI